MSVRPGPVAADAGAARLAPLRGQERSRRLRALARVLVAALGAVAAASLVALYLRVLWA